MEVNDKIKFIRLFKGCSQEEMANKLHMSAKGYAKIERGEVDITLSKLKQISKALEVEVKELIGLDENNVFNFIENFRNYIHFSNSNNNGVVQQCDCKHELEKMHLLLEQKENEINYLKKIIEELIHRKVPPDEGDNNP